MSQKFTLADRDNYEKRRIKHSVKRDSSLLNAVSEFAPHRKKRTLVGFPSGAIQSSVSGNNFANLEDAFKFVDLFLSVSYRCICTFDMLKAWLERTKNNYFSVELLNQILDIYPGAYALSYQHVLNTTGTRELKLVIDSAFKSIPRIRLAKAIMERRYIFRQRLLEIKSCSPADFRLRFGKGFTDSLNCAPGDFNPPVDHSAAEFFQPKPLLPTYLSLDKKTLGEGSLISAQHFKSRSALSNQSNAKTDQSEETVFSAPSSSLLSRTLHKDDIPLSTLVLLERNHKQQTEMQGLGHQKEGSEHSFIGALQLANMIWSFFSTSRKSTCLYSALTRHLTYVHKNPTQTLDETKAQFELIFRSFPFWISLHPIEGEQWVKIVKSSEVFSQVQRWLKNTIGMERTGRQVAISRDR